MDRVLIDANSLGHAAHQGTVLKSGDQETQAVFGVIKAMRALRITNPEASILTLWDGLSWRKAESTAYKSNRDDTPKKLDSRKRYKSQTPFIRKALKLLGMPQLMAANLEADDLAALLVRQSVAKGDFIRLVTGDQDWLQLVGPTCIWEDHRDSSRRVNANSFAKFTGFPTVDQFVQAKAIQGDTSDALPGVGGVGEERGTLLLQIWGSVEAFWADKNPSSTWDLKAPQKPNKAEVMMAPAFPKALKDFHQNVDGKHEKFRHNFRLMNLRGELPKPDRMTLSKGEFDPDGFKTLCHELGFSTIYRPSAFDNWVAPFLPRTKN